MRVSEVPPNTIDIIKPAIDPLIVAGCEESFGIYTPQSIYARLKAGRCVLLIAGERASVSGGAVISVQSFDGLNAVMVELLEGTQLAQDRILDYVEHAAEIAGCQAVLIHRTKGHNKKRGTNLPDYRLTHFLLKKDIQRAVRVA